MLCVTLRMDNKGDSAERRSQGQTRLSRGPLPHQTVNTKYKAQVFITKKKRKGLDKTEEKKQTKAGEGVGSISLK